MLRVPRRLLCASQGGRSLHDVVQRLRPYAMGWKAYFGLAQTPKVWREMVEWLRHLRGGGLQSEIGVR